MKEPKSFFNSQTKLRHSQAIGLAAIQDLYPNPPVLRYHHIAPKIERGFGTIAADEQKKINLLDVVVAFFLGYFIGGWHE